MPVMIAAVVLMGVLVTLDLILSVGIIRRLRTLSMALGQLRQSTSMPDVMLTAGTSVGEFAAPTVDGQQVSAASLKVPTLVGFFMPHCGGCVEAMPRFIEYARTLPEGRNQAIAVVVAGGGDDDEVASYNTRLGAVARVVVEEPDGPVARAFAVTGFPAFCLVGPGQTVLGSGHSIDGVLSSTAA